MTEEEIAAAERVVDLDQDEITCPACLATFPSGARACPDCGLNLGG